MAQHTEGPWETNGDPYVSTAGGKQSIAFTDVRGISKAEAKANARLIAQAPCMLKLLKEARERVEQNIKSLIESHTVPSTGLLEGDAVLAVEAEQDFLNEIDAVIAKATT